MKTFNNKRLIEVIERIIYRGDIKNDSELSKECGQRKTYVYELRKGIIQPNAAFLVALEKKYRVNLEYLHTGEGDPFMIADADASKTQLIVELSELKDKYLALQEKFIMLQEEIIKLKGNGNN